MRSSCGSPNAIQDLPVAGHCDRLHASLLLKRSAVVQEGVEHVTTRALTRHVHHGTNVSIPWEFLRELEGASRDAFLDGRQVLTGTAQLASVGGPAALCSLWELSRH